MNKVIKALDHFGNSLKKEFNPYDSRLGQFIIDTILWPVDLYKVTTDYKKRFGVFPNLLLPQKFTEGLQQLKLINRRLIHAQFADKIGVRRYVAETIGDRYLPKLIWSGSDIRGAGIDKLPSSFVIKSNNGSGTILIVKNKVKADWKSIHQTTQRWLGMDLSSHFGEWQYRWIKPALLIEELLQDHDGKVPPDYKFFCFRGKVHVVQVDLDRFTGHTLTLLNREFKVLPVTHVYKRHGGEIPKPKSYDEMIHLAEKLAGREKFIRIDFYEVNDRPVFGEMTLHPSAGREGFDPPEWDIILGEVLSGKRSNVP